MEKRREKMQTNHSGAASGDPESTAGADSLGALGPGHLKPGLQSLPPAGGSGLCTPRVGASLPGGRWPRARRRKVPSLEHFAPVMRAGARARSVRCAWQEREARGLRRRLGLRLGLRRPEQPAACGERPELGGPAGGGWRASGRLARLPGTLRAHGGGGRTPRWGSPGRALRTTRPPSSPRPPSGSCCRETPPDPSSARPGLTRGSGGRRRRRRRRDCLFPAPRVSSPRHREGQGDWARGPRPVSARVPGPPLACALSPRAGTALASPGAGRSHEPGRGPQRLRATGQRCPQRARCPGASSPGPARDAAAASAPRRPTPDHPKVRGGRRVRWGTHPGPPFRGFLSPVPR